MKYKIAKTNSPAAMLRRAAIAGSLALVALLGVNLGAGAQTPNDINLPTPYTWSTFHSGGTGLNIDPFSLANSVPPITATTGSLNQPFPPSPLYSQLQGTPSGFTLLDANGNLQATSIVTEVPSFLLGNYSPSVPPIGIDATNSAPSFFPNHFQDDQFAITQWQAPYVYQSLASNGTEVTADSSDTTLHTYGPNLGVLTGWSVQFSVAPGGGIGWSGEFADSTAADSAIAPTRTPGYVRAAAVLANNTQQYAKATWTLTAPSTTVNSSGPGQYSVVLHLPNPVTDSTSAAYPETRISDAHYVITDTTGTATRTIFDGRIGQTETNDPQYLAGPFTFAAGDIVRVTLDNSTQLTVPNPGSTYVLADSVSLVPGAAGGGAALSGSPTAINATEYPEIQNAEYYGIKVGTVSTPDTDAATSLIPVYHGNATVVAAPARDQSNSTAIDAGHRINQLVYFGRYESITLTDGNGNPVNAAGVATTTPVTQQVGAIYCVDGVTGGVVWRYQTPDVLSAPIASNPTVFSGSQSVFSTPSIARINVLTSKVGAIATYATKLVVVVADGNGMVYCLDAIGNRNGTSNSAAISINYNQPIYNPAAPVYDPANSTADLFGQPYGTAGAPLICHTGTTNAYWIYRPYLAATAGVVKTPDATSDLPIPLAFGLASPTIYINPNQPLDTTTLVPGANSSTTLTSTNSNATVYIGNSNGTMYALDGLGVAQPTAPAAAATGLNLNDPYDTSHFIGIRSAAFDLNTTPTTAPIWWFAANGVLTGTSDTTDSVSITSAPAIKQDTFLSATTNTVLTKPVVIFTTADDTDNVGRVYAVDGTTGGTLAAGTAVIPGSKNYNGLVRPTWVFPNAYKDIGSGAAPHIVRPPLGSIDGSPVVFTNPDDTTGRTLIYVAANSNEDQVTPADQGRIWAINAADGTAVWAYPTAYDPNTSTDLTKSVGTLVGGATSLQTPLGAFQNASPAIGVVQFPATIFYGPTGSTQYVHTDSAPVYAAPASSGKRTSNDVRGQNVPMLYIGSHTESLDSSNFYALDLDGITDNQRNIFYFGQDTQNPPAVAPVGTTANSAGFECSPLLVVNSSTSTTPGNGGVIFITGGDNTLYEISATQLSDYGTVANNANGAPEFTRFAQYGGFGPFSSPAVAAFNGTPLLSATAGAASGTAIYSASAIDWVYGGDGVQGIARGITPKNLVGSGAAGTSYGDGGQAASVDGANYVPQQFPLHAYIFDGTAAHKAGDANMGNANGIGDKAALPVFEWGQPVYIRLSNVVPPNTAVLDTTSGAFITGDQTHFMHDSTLASTDPGSDVIYTNGGPITVQLTDVDATGNTVASGETDSVTIPSAILTDVTTATTVPLGNGFMREAGTGAQDSDGDLLVDTTSKAWIGATTYAIGDGSNRKNTPGARRRIVSATQVAQAYAPAASGNGYTFVGSVTLQINVNSSATTVARNVSYTNGTASGTFQRIAPVDQPTFGILNPIAVRGAGYPLQHIGAAPAYAVPVSGVGTGQLGPFTGVSASTPSATDLESYANGNRVPTVAPTSGVVGSNNSVTKPRYVPIIVSTNDINHGTTGDNSDPTNLTTPPLVGSTTSNTIPEPTTSTAQPLTYGPYTLNVADRSALGTINSQIKNLTIQTAAAQWQDNSGNYGPGAVVNALPWDTMPQAYPGQGNTSTDYPDISANVINHNLITNQFYGRNGGLNPGMAGNISNQPGMPDPATPDAGGDASKRNVYLDPVQVQIKVPQFQPANLQLYDQTQGGITPEGITANSVVFPQGYANREFVYIDSNHNHRYDRGEAYRQIRVITGVPVDLSTAIQNTTVDMGRLPQSFGVQTQGFTTAFGTTPALGLFDPYNANYLQFIRPLTIVNKGNTNLINLHLDQKFDVPNASPPVQGASLPFASDALDNLSLFYPYDPLGGTTGPRTATVNGTVVEQPYLLRSSLDPDLVTAYGQNAFLSSANYPGATAHKARVGDTAPSIVTVPDVSHDNDPALAGTLPNMAISSVPTIGSASQPFIALAVPLGTPVGTYSFNLQAYEGLDPTGYLDVYNQSGGGNKAPYAAILPPQYGGVAVSAVTATSPSTNGLATPANLNDSITLVQNGATGRYTPLQPYSNATVVKATVTETRITDGASRGNLPQVDPGPTGNTNNNPPPSANFLPSAFRDSTTGNLSLYWTSSRGATATAPYTLVGENLDFSQGYFKAANVNQNWWAPIDLTAAAPLANSVNSGISVFTDNATGSNAVYALVQNVAGGGTVPTTNKLACYAVTASSGALTGAGSRVTQNTSQATFGAHGLVTGTFPDASPTNPQDGGIRNNIWAFWYGGARGRSAIYYNSAQAQGGGAPGAFGTSAVLPIPAGLVSVSDPVAVETSSPDPADKTQNKTQIDSVIEVTYTGIAPDGNADIYVSRYRPYIVRQADNKTPAKDANGNNIVALALLPSPTITEQLQATDGNLYYQARDVAWARADTINVFVGATSVLQNLTGTQNTDGSYPLYNGVKATYDQQTSSLVFTGVPSITINSQTYNINAIYVDLARGRIRFSPQLPVGTYIAAYATFNAQARRITTDSRADTAPVAFLDMSYKANDLPGEARIPVDRYWYLWRKSGATGTSTTPTLYYKTQRLSIALHDANGNPITPALVTGTAPASLVPKQLIVTDTLTGTSYYNSANAVGGAIADVDIARGRIYFPITALSPAIATEGRSVTVQLTYNNGNASPSITYTDNIHWLDEPRYQSTGNPNSTTGPGTTTAIAATATDDAAIPIDTITNESNVTAFLDPEVIQRDTQTIQANTTEVPHKVWLFWNSTRNGTADLYYETISPLFSGSVGG